MNIRITERLSLYLAKRKSAVYDAISENLKHPELLRAFSPYTQGENGRPEENPPGIKIVQINLGSYFDYNDVVETPLIGVDTVTTFGRRYLASHLSRFVDIPRSPTQMLTIVGVKGRLMNDNKIIAAYAGTHAPKEPWTMIADRTDPQSEIDKAISFWQTHAFSFDTERIDDEFIMSSIKKEIELLM